MVFFEDVQLYPPDPILGLNLAFTADLRENKVNLGVGTYKTVDLKPLILNTVKKAEAHLLESETSKDYLPIDGLTDYVQASKELIFAQTVAYEQVAGAQTLGGAGALRVGSIFLKQHGFSTVYVSDPTWDNHHRIFSHAGLEVKRYPYFNARKLCFDFEAFGEALQQIPPKSIIVLQPCCHNPTGFDPTFEQWKQICEWALEKEFFVFFDSAYQGFGEDLEKDAATIRYFAERGLQFALALSHSKNFGLYAERTGALFFTAGTPDEAKRVTSCLKVIIRGLYSNPPCHGARIVSLILNNSELKQHWIHELATMRDRISEMRKTLLAELQSKTTKRTFDFLAHQKGMFSYTGLNREQVDQLTAEYGIYMTKDGRINVAGLNTKNLEYVADAIIAVAG